MNGVEPRRGKLCAIAAALSLAATLSLAAPASALEPLDQIGSLGSGAGQLQSPTAIVTDPAGNLFVADRSNHRVSEFGPSGAFIRAFGWDVIPGPPAEFEVCTAATGCQAGAFSGGAPGQLNSPQAITIDAAGNLAVADSFNNRVSQFTTQGAFIRAFGFDVIPGPPAVLETCTAGTGCKAGVAGGAAGQLNLPRGIATGSDGSLLLGDTDNDRVSQFTTQGAFIRAFGFDVRPGAPAVFEVCTAVTGCQPGVAGGVAGQLDDPRGVATDGAGRLFVGDVNNNRVSQFTVQGAFVRAFGFDVRPGMPVGLEVCTQATGCKQGVGGGAAGQLDTPRGLATGASGSLIVADSGNERVSEFAIPGAFSRAFGVGVIPGAPAGFEVCTAATGCRPGLFGNGVGQHNFPTDIATDCRGAIYVAEESGNRVLRFGEAGTPPPPCPPPEAPSNEFSFGKVKKNKKRGTAKLTVIVPGPGVLVLAGKKLKGDTEQVGGAAAAGAGGAGIEANLTVKSKGKAKRALKRRGKAKVKPEVTYTPDGGEPNTKSTKIKLKKRN